MKKQLPYLPVSFVLLFVVITISRASSATAQAKPDAGQSVQYKLKEVNLPEEKRPQVRYSKEQLPFKNIGGNLPSYDGEQFQINLRGQSVGSAEAAKRIATQFLESLKSPLKMDGQIRMSTTATTAEADQKFIDEQIRAGEEKTRKNLSGRFNNVSKSSNDMLTEMAGDLRKEAQARVSVYRFDEWFEEDIIDNTAIAVASRSETGVTSIQGRFYNAVTVTNHKELSAPDAISRGVAQIRSDNNYDNVVGDSANARIVLVPYGDGFKYAWKTIVTADGPYQVWFDAETGAVLQLLPNFFFANSAKGLAFFPDPNRGTREMSFEVDAPTDGKYTLKNTGVLVLTNNGTDGTSGIVQINDDGSGTANFNVSPINGTVVEHTSQSGYNGLFQQVNIFSHIYNERTIYRLLGSQDFGEVDVTFNIAGDNSFCCPPTYYTGAATLSSSSTTCTPPCNSDLHCYNAGIDATVIAHEFGHQLNGLQFGVGGGILPSNLNEGMADFWAITNFDTDVFAGWWVHDCATPTQSGYGPRRAEATDIFPDRNSSGCASNEAHSAGQIISWANWSARQGMNNLTGWGTLSIDINLIKAMTTAGIGLTNLGTDKGIHDSYVDLLNQIASLYGSSRLIHKLLAGYARAGIFLAPKDAIVDIDDNYLDRTSATGPVFNVWTGRDYTFSGTTVSTAAPPYNTQFMVEVANDEAFTSNLVSSGWLGGVVSGAGGMATWTLPASNWNTLKAADAIYYRVTTRDADAGNVRQSWNPGNGTLTNVPVGKAAINGTGTMDCTCSACSVAGAENSSPMALIPIIPLAILVLYRRRNQRKWKGSAPADH